MMIRKIALLPALVLAATLGSSAANAEPEAHTYDLATKQTDVMSAGEYDGKLKLRVFPNGIVAGTFMDTQGHVSSVTGGLDGTKIWIDLGAASPTSAHLFVGTFADGKLVANAQHSSGLRTWVLNGTPSNGAAP